MIESHNKTSSGPLGKGLLIFGNSACDPLPLYSLITYKGTMQAIVAAMILEKDPNQEDLTKLVYPETGKYFRVSGTVVEHNIRLLINALWEEKRSELVRFLGGESEQAPTAEEFVKYLASRSQENRRAS